MLNSAMINEQANVFADFLQKKAGKDPSAQVRLALKRSCQRKPNKGEVDRGVRLIQSMKDNYGLDDKQALKYFCLVALNLNEFMYLD